MPSLAADFASLVNGVQRPGDFCTGGVVPIYSPRLEVDGVGAVALPLMKVQAKQLVAVASRAPFGRGAQTLIDINVRRSWQIEADRVTIEGREWTKTVASIVERAAEGLGVAGPVAAEFYKLLVYDEGSFFVGHRDTEKAKGMFATLVIVLPSIFSGGDLIVRHKEREKRFALQGSDPSEAAFAAFYADCVHEVSPVTSGCRLTLISSNSGALPFKAAVAQMVLATFCASNSDVCSRTRQPRLGRSLRSSLSGSCKVAAAQNSVGHMLWIHALGLDRKVLSQCWNQVLQAAAPLTQRGDRPENIGTCTGRQLAPL